MRNLKWSLIPALVSLLIISACTLTKRQYVRGYHVEWLNKKNTRPVAHTSSKRCRASAAPAHERYEQLSASVNTDLYSEAQSFKRQLPLAAPQIKKNSLRDCDVIVFPDGAEESVRVLLVGETEVRYRRCSNPHGPVYVRFKRDIFLIKYANGTNTVITSPHVDKNQNTESTTTKQYAGEGHDQALALVLCIFGYNNDHQRRPQTPT